MSSLFPGFNTGHTKVSKRSTAYHDLSVDCIVLLEDDIEEIAVFRFSDKRWFMTKNMRDCTNRLIGWREVPIV